MRVTSPQAVRRSSVNVEEGSESRVQMVDKGEDSIKEGTKTKEATAGNQEVNVWTLVSPAKIGRLFSSTQKEDEIQISASKFSVLSVEEEEECEIVAEVRNGLEVAVSEVNEEIEIFEGEMLLDDNLEQQERKSRQGREEVGRQRLQMKIRVRAQDLPDENINNGELLLECARI